MEYRPPDLACHGYLAFAAMLMAGLDGIENRIDPGEPIDKDLYDLPPEEADKAESTPGSLEEVPDALEADHEFLLTRRRVHARRARHVAELQAGKRGGAGAPAPASLCVPPLLRHPGPEAITRGWRALTGPHRGSLDAGHCQGQRFSN